MGRRAGTWEARRTRLCAPLYSPEVHRAVSALVAFAGEHEGTVRLLQRQLPPSTRSERVLGEQLDAALALLWHSQSVPVHSLVDRLCKSALGELHLLAQHTLAEADFATLSTLQHGATGTVEVVRCKFDRRLYVMKSILKGVARREPYRFSPVFESQLLGLEGDQCTPQLHAAFQGPGSVHIIMEYFPSGDLDALLRAAAEAQPGYPGKSSQGGLLQEAWAVRYAADMVAAIGWLHTRQFVHRDIKPSNFLLHRTGRLKLCDFATCAPFAFFGDERRVLQFYTQRPAGTCDYIAPDILAWEQQRIREEYPSPGASTSVPSAPEPDACIAGAYGPEVDWWSMGVVLYEMVFGALPFWAPSPTDVYDKIAHHEHHFSMDASIPCSDELRALIAALVCPAHQRLGRRSTAEVQHHPVFRAVPWTALDAWPVPFVPAHADPEPDLMPSVLHSPRPHATPAVSVSLTMDTPPSFSQMYQGPLDAFPIFPDSFASPPQPGSDAGSRPSSPAPASPARAWPTAGASPHAAAEPSWAQIDTHFQGFSYVPCATAFALDDTPTLSPDTRPLASTPYAKSRLGPPLSPELRIASPLPEDGAALQRRAVHAALRVRGAGIDLHTPFRAPAADHGSPYPFPVASGTLGSLPSPDVSPRAYDTMGSDSRHSGGSTWQRNLSERQAWTEMMDAVQRSARKPEAALAGARLDDLAEEDENSPLVSRRSSVRSPALLDAAPALPMATSCLDVRRRMHPLESSSIANLDRERTSPRLRTQRSTRQLLLDAQLNTTPTRPARGFSLPSPPKPLPSGRITASPPRRRGLLKGSASVRDFREVLQHEHTLPTLADIAVPSTHHARRDASGGSPAMDSHRTLSEYRRGLAHGRPPVAPSAPPSEDGFGRPTGLRRPGLRGLERTARRMQSSLGLSSAFRQGAGDAKENALQRLSHEHRHIQQSVTSLEHELDELKSRVDHVGLGR